MRQQVIGNSAVQNLLDYANLEAVYLNVEKPIESKNYSPEEVRIQEKHIIELLSNKDSFMEVKDILFKKQWLSVFVNLADIYKEEYKYFFQSKQKE